MDDKYYIPEAEELFYGYECDMKFVNESNSWIITELDYEDLYHVINDKVNKINFTLIRTKYLDEDDILSLGFKKEKSLMKDVLFYNKKETIISYMPDIHIVIISRRTRKMVKMQDCRFQGNIKSINELKTILKLIGYE